MTALPDVPTAAEAGVKNYTSYAWLAMLAPAGTPHPVIDKIYKAMAEALKNPKSTRASPNKAPNRSHPGRMNWRSSSRRKPSNGARSSIRRDSTDVIIVPHQSAAIHTLAGTHMTPPERVLIAGAGPVGLVAAANLVRHGIPVTVSRSAPTSAKFRASTFHPPTLDMLADLDVVQSLIAQGLLAPKFQYRSSQYGLIAQFDFAGIADLTRHPFRLQCEQSKLTRILLKNLARIRISKSCSQARFARWIRTAVASP